MEVHAFLDPGSNTTFCTKSLINRLGVQGDEASLSLTTMNNGNVQSVCNAVNLMVYDGQEKNAIELPSVCSCEKLPVAAKHISTQVDVNQWPYLKGIKLPSIESDKVNLLIGNDVPIALEPKQVRESQKGGPYAVKTVLGWTISGPLGRKRSSQDHLVNLINANVQLNE